MIPVANHMTVAVSNLAVGPDQRESPHGAATGLTNGPAHDLRLPPVCASPELSSPCAVEERYPVVITRNGEEMVSMWSMRTVANPVFRTVCHCSTC